MTTQKKLKKTIRARSRKTGESYTAARRQVLMGRERKAGGATAAAAPKAAPARGASARQSEASLIEKTGHGLDHWFAVLGRLRRDEEGPHGVGGASLRGARSAGLARADGHRRYERERGLRAINQSSAGDFQVSVTKSVPTSVGEVADALGRAERRRAWLRAADPGLSRALNAAFEGPKAKQVTIKSPTHARLRFRWGRATVEIHVYAKPKGGSSIVAANTGLERGELVEERCAQWKVALEKLKDHLSR